MAPGKLARSGIVLILLAILFACPASGAPSSHIREEVSANYFTNGTLDGNVTTTGYVEVNVENQADVLQTVRLQLSGISGTNLQSDTAYKNVAASPYAADTTRIYVNTTRDSQDIVYNITDPNIAGIIRLKLEYYNSVGGTEICSGGTNTFNFNLTINATKNVSSVITNMRFSKDTLGQNDAIDLYSPSATSGIAQRIDSDWDGFYDIIRWTGDLTKGNPVVVSFQGSITPDVNFDESLMRVDLDKEAQSIASSSQDSTLTGITFIDRFSRGPVRQGIEMIERATWTVKGFIKNIATGLDYIVHGWEIYRIGQQNPVDSSSQSSYLNPGDTTYTDWYDTGSSSKYYYTSSFDWEVVWGNSQYSGITQSRIYLPVLYEMDSFVDKTVNLNSNTQSGRVVSVTDLARHLGHSGLGVDGVNITSRIPGSSVTGEGTSWSLSSVQVIYSNNTGQYDITPYASISMQNANPGQDGFVVVNVTDLQSILGHALSQNEDILLYYTLSGPSQPTTQSYNFWVQASLITESGTPVTKNANQTITIPGVYVPPAPGVPGPAYPPPKPFASIEKELSDVYFVTPEYVEINVTDRVIDTGLKGVKDIKAMVYVPQDGSLDMGEVYISVFHSSSGAWEHWERDREFTVTYTGVMTIGENDYREYVIEKKRTGTPYEETLDLFNDDRIKVSFRTYIPVGTSHILTRVFGYNYYEDKLIFEDVYTPVRREGIISRLEVEEKPWVQGEAVVGKPVTWTKEFEVHNPNNVTVEEVVQAQVFQDVLSIYLLEYGDGEPVRTKLKIKSNGETYTDWVAKLGILETRIYALEVTTPPVLETREVLDVLESNETTVMFFLNMTLVNFALEDYRNVSFPLPVSGDNIISLQDEQGNELDFVKRETGIEVYLGFMEANQTKSVYLVYRETPPVMITTLETLNYRCPDFVSGDIFIIPGERERGAYLEMEVMGPDPELKTLYANLILVGDLREFEEKRIPVHFSTSSFVSGRYTIYTKFKKDFSTILYHQRDFVIECPEREIISISWIIFALAAAGIVGLLAFRVYRKRTYEREIRELKRRIKGI